MTRQCYAIGTILAIALALTTSSFAQGPMRAEIPFDFYVGDTSMQAGTYTVSHLANGRIIQILGDQGQSLFAMTIPATNLATDKTSRLVFSRYGRQNFLSRLYWTGSSSANELNPARLELETRRSTKPAQVAIKAK